MHGNQVEPRTASLLRRATYASVSVATVLVGVKIAAWLLTGSLSVLASLVDSLMDVAASVVNLLAIRYSLKSADDDHKFGHGKAEYLAGLGQSLFIASSAVFLMVNGVQRLANPRPLESVPSGVAVMIFAIFLTLLLLIYQRYVVKKTGSTAIKADSLHYATDLFTNLGTITALIIAGYGWPGFDPVFAIGLSLVIFYNAWKIGYESIHLLMDRQLPPETEETITIIALRHKNVLGVHDIRTRQAGQVKLIQLHLEMADNLSLGTAHKAAKEVEAGIRNIFPDADIIIHQDPVNPG
ncbi:MAG: cation diffusion facilitator family transporter [Proteobacteria bacterium]|nr:cation diffusion facilitator family transporter [Pseudomonadota bacterium]MBU1714854.1 cation diffusion facilitator family transporter [Pseudomonadota bacterium]